MNHTSKIFYIILTILITKISSASAEIKIEYDDSGLPFISPCLGSKKTCLSLRLDTDYINTLVQSDKNTDAKSKNKYDRTSSENSSVNKENEELEYDSEKVTADLITDKIAIDSYELYRANFYLIQKTKSEELNKIDGIFGLGLPTTTKQEKKSLMIQLFLNNYISSRIWTLDFTDKKSNLKGEKNVDNSVGKDFELKENENGHWFISIKSILLGQSIKNDKNIEFGKKSKIKIATAKNKTSIELDVLKEVKNSYFKKLIDNSDCKFIEKDDYSTIFCKKNDYEELSDISIMFDGYGISIPKDKVLVKTENDEEYEYEFILCNSDDDDNNSLGMNILNNMKIVFDIENMKVGLYGGYMVDITKKEEEEEKKKKEEEEKKKKEEEEKKKKEEEEEKKKEEEEKKKEEEEKKKKEEEEKNKENNNNNNNNQQNQQQDKAKVIDVKPKSSFLKSFGKVILFFGVLLGIYFLWVGIKSYRRRRYRNKNPFAVKSNIENLNGIQLMSSD